MPPSRVSKRRAAAQQRARRRRIQRIALVVGLTVGIVAVAGVGFAWLLGRDGSDASASQALYQFDTADYHSLAFDPVDTDTLYFGHHGGMKVSQNGGESWQDASLQGADVMQQSIPIDGSNRRYAAGHDVFYVSDDGGQSWQFPPNNLPGLDLHGFAAAPTDSNRLYAFEVTSRGFYTSSDGGTSWETLELPPGMTTGMLPLAVGYDDPQHLFAGVGSQVLESRDGGATWDAIPGPGSQVITIAVHPDDAQQLLVGTVDGLWRRGPDGNWSKLSVESDGSILAVALHPQEPDRIVALDQQGNFYRSDNGGETWGRA